MNWKKFILLSCVVSCVFAISIATAQMRGHRAPMLNSASRFHRFNRFNDGDFDRDDRFRHFRRFNNRTFIFVDTFGFPFFYPYPYYGCYPYDYYGYNDSGYGYGNTVVEVQRRLLALGTIMVPSMGSWDLKRDEQFALTNATTISARTA
jgi:hypothetical protein